MEARAFEQQRAIAREARDVEADQRAKQEFATRQTVTGLEINERLRTDAERQRETDFSSYAAENPDMSVKDLKEAAFKQFKFSPAQWQKVVTTRLGIENAEMDSFKNNVRKKLQGKNINQVGELYNTDPDFDDKTDLAIVPGKGGAVTLNFIDKATKTVKESQTFKNQAMALEYLNKQATEPETIGSWMMNLRKTESAIEAQSAATTASNAATNLSNVRAGALKRDAATQAKLDKIEQDFEALTPDEKVGAKGRALITSYNMASAGPGRQLSLGAAVKPEFTPKDYAATVKSFTDAGFSLTDSLIRADQLYGRGPAAANEDVDLQAADKAKGGKTNAPAEKVGLTTQPAAPAPAAQPPRPPNTVEAIQAANLQKLVPLANEFKAAEQQFIAAARSGDQKAIAQYLQKKEVLRQQLESQLEKQFGNTAPAAYKQLLSLGS